MCLKREFFFIYNILYIFCYTSTGLVGTHDAQTTGPLEISVSYLLKSHATD